MTRFIYLSDTHWGNNNPGYTMQHTQPNRLPELLAALEEWIKTHGTIDFILHGGDMIDSTNPKNIDFIAQAFELSVPVYLCLGNHDLTCENALEIWLDRAPHFFQGAANFSIETSDCLLHVVPNQWGPMPYYWDGLQEPHFSVEQEQFINNGLERDLRRVHILSTHSPFHGVPIEQSGFKNIYHHPPQTFVERGHSLLKEHHNLQCILGAHSHINTCIEQNGNYLITSSSFVEMPFDFKCINISEGQITMATHCLVDHIDDVGTNHYDFSKTFVQGRTCDRTIRQ